MLSLLLVLLLPVLAVLLAFLLWVAVEWVYRPFLIYRDFKSQSIPGPAYCPIMGQLTVMWNYEDQDKFLDMFVDHTTQYGNISTLQLGPPCYLQVNDPHYLVDVFRGKASYYHKSVASNLYLGAAMGHDNLLLLEGATHTKHRRMVQPAFHHIQLKQMIPIIIREANTAINKWETRVKQQQQQQATSATTTTNPDWLSVELHQELSTLTFCIISACAFGEQFHTIPHAAETVQEALEVILHSIRYRVEHLIEHVPIVKLLPIIKKTEMEQQRTKVFTLVDQVIAQRKAKNKLRKPDPSSVSHNDNNADLLDLMLNAIDPETGTSFSATEVRHECVAFVLAGHETTSNLMAWMLYVLMQKPELWEQCMEEVDRVTHGQPPTAEQLNQIPLCEAVMHETMRLFPPAPILAKQANAAHFLSPDASGGKTRPPLHIPETAEILIHIHVLHRLSEYWGEDAHVFDHTRWMKDKKPYSHPCAFLPFSMGPRNCIGQQFALIEAKVILILLMQRVKMKLVPGQKMTKDGYPPGTSVVTLRPKYGISALLQPRAVTGATQTRETNGHASASTVSTGVTISTQ